MAAGASSQALSSLTAGSTYTYSAYSDASCNTLLATAAAFTTTGGSVGNLSEPLAQGSPGTTGGAWLAHGFVTDSSKPGGYTLDRVVVSLSGNSNLTLRLFSTASGTTNPGASLATLTASGGVDANGDYTFTCSGSGCDLSANTRYFLVVNSAAGYSHTWKQTTSSNQTNAPSSRSWAIADTYRSSTSSGSSWGTAANALKLKATYSDK